MLPTANADTLTLFQSGEIDGAWAPEPWATRLEQEAGGVEFLNEKDLWPDGKFVTTHLIVRTEFLEEHPDVVENLLRAHVETTEWINANPDEAKTLVNESIEAITSKPLAQAVIDAAWENIEITYDPMASSLYESAEAAAEIGFLDENPDLSTIYVLDPLNAILAELNLDPVRRSDFDAETQMAQRTGAEVGRRGSWGHESQLTGAACTQRYRRLPARAARRRDGARAGLTPR